MNLEIYSAGCPQDGAHTIRAPPPQGDEAAVSPGSASLSWVSVTPNPRQTFHHSHTPRTLLALPRAIFFTPSSSRLGMLSPPTLSFSSYRNSFCLLPKHFLSTCFAIASFLCPPPRIFVTDPLVRWALTLDSSCISLFSCTLSLFIGSKTRHVSHAADFPFLPLSFFEFQIWCCIHFYSSAQILSNFDQTLWPCVMP